MLEAFNAACSLVTAVATLLLAIIHVPRNASPTQRLRATGTRMGEGPVFDNERQVREVMTLLQCH
jgi:hypothetical protein